MIVKVYCTCWVVCSINNSNSSSRLKGGSLSVYNYKVNAPTKELSSCKKIQT